LVELASNSRSITNYIGSDNTRALGEQLARDASAGGQSVLPLRMGFAEVMQGRRFDNSLA
jgi:hypothetical protein